MKAVLLDTDYLISRIFKNQSTHKKAVDVANLMANKTQFLTNLVLFEMGTVLSHKFSHSQATAVIKDIQTSTLSIIRPSEEDEQAAWNIFFKQRKKGISLTDCMNLHLARTLKYQIASFDSFYPKKFLVR